MADKSLFCLVFALICRINGRVPEVTTPLGKIIGTTMVTRLGRNINAFMTIPYAQPPVGPLRFRSPVPVEPWRGTLRANIEPPPCAQVTESGQLDGVEDCLYVNVYTPQVIGEQISQDLLPVMVYIHGGAFQYGNTRTNYLGPNFILDKNVILVTLQYRLSILGFISTGDSVAPGNFGLKDQALALRWIHDNIKYFGGNPENVTLFGQSSGSVSVNFHVLSNHSKGLFHRYITQSGSVLCPWVFAFSSDYKQHAFALGDYYNCSTNSSQVLINCLRQVSAYDLIANDKIFTGMQQTTKVTWIPTDEPDIDGAFITEHPLKTILSNKFQDLPNISGVVKDEGLLLTSNLYVNETLYKSFLGDINQTLHYLASSYIPSEKGDRLAMNLRKFYFDHININNKSEVLQGMTDFMSDVGITFPQILQLQLVSQRIKNPSYFYSFEYRGTFSKTSLVLKTNDNIGVTHADDIIYLFPTVPEDFDCPDLRMNERDYNMIDIMIEMWTNFAIIGVPKTSYNDNPYLWEPYADTDKHLQIGAANEPVLTTKHNFLDNRMHFWAMQILKLIF